MQYRWGVPVSQPGTLLRLCCHRLQSCDSGVPCGFRDGLGYCRTDPVVEGCGQYVGSTELLGRDQIR